MAREGSLAYSTLTQLISINGKHKWTSGRERAYRNRTQSHGPKNNKEELSATYRPGNKLENLSGKFSSKAR